MNHGNKEIPIFMATYLRKETQIIHELHSLYTQFTLLTLSLHTTNTRTNNEGR